MKEISLWTISLFHLQSEKEKLTAPHIKINQSHLSIHLFWAGGEESTFVAHSHWPRQTPILTHRWFNRFEGWVLKIFIIDLYCYLLGSQSQPVWNAVGSYSLIPTPIRLIGNSSNPFLPNVAISVGISWCEQTINIWIECEWKWNPYIQCITCPFKMPDNLSYRPNFAAFGTTQ